jgi:NagD protein
MYFIDVQGTLIEDNTKLPTRGAIELIEYLNARQIPYMVITNSTKNPSEEFLGYLHSIGLAIPHEHYLDPLMMLQSHVDLTKRVAAYGSEPFIEVLRNMGYALDFVSPEVVLVAIKENFLPDEYAQMIEFLLGGAQLVGMHETTLYVKNRKRYPGVGAILKMLEFATSVPYTVVGKPSAPFFEEALLRLKQQAPSACFESVTIISDDLKGDLVGAQTLGMRGVLVLSGKIRSADEIIPSLKPHEYPAAIYADVQEVLESL